MNRTALWPFLLAAPLLGAAAAGAADPSPEGEVKGFVMPRGDAARGLAAFVELGCNQCHLVAGVELPAYEGVSSLRIELAGKQSRVRRYGELLTAIVEPDHSLAEQYRTLLTKEEESRGASAMPDFTQRMTVRQLLDVAAFLHSRYQLAP